MPTRGSSEGGTGEEAASTLVCVDTGTTNTRAWLVAGDRIAARREAAVGARDTARDGHDRALRKGLHDLIGRLSAEALRHLETVLKLEPAHPAARRALETLSTPPTPRLRP